MSGAGGSGFRELCRAFGIAVGLQVFSCVADVESLWLHGIWCTGHGLKTIALNMESAEDFEPGHPSETSTQFTR